MGRDDEGSSWVKQLLVVVGLVAVVAVLIGGVTGFLALGAVNVLGLGAASRSVTQEPSLYMPSEEPTTTPQVFPAPTQSPSASQAPSAQVQPSPSKKAKPKPPKEITLQGFPNQVSPGQRINLTGVYPRAEGATLQVQRFEGGWTDFPVSASVSGGIFNTYVTTSRTGEIRFRVLDKASGRHSNDVRITVG